MLANEFLGIAAYVGAAPIDTKILKYFASIDLPIYEVFGQSECTGPHCVNSVDFWQIGTCGKALPGTETKISEDSGELCYRGRHIFAGYMGMEEMTTETIDSEGWLHRSVQSYISYFLYDKLIFYLQ